MYPSEAHPSYGVFIRNHVAKMEADHGIRFELAVSTSRPANAREKIKKYAELYGRTVLAMRHDVDLVHLHYPSPVFAPAALLPRKPLVITSHGGDINMPPLHGAKKELVASVLSRASAVIAVSGDVARMLAGFGVPDTKLHVIDMGCDLSLFTFAIGRDKAPIKRSLGLDPERAVILFAGDLIHRKGCDLFFDALAQIPETQACTILVVGSGPEKERLSRHLIAPRVQWLGAMPQKELARYFAAADVFVFPTRDEPLGLVSLEAMASGTPVVAANVGGVPEIVKHEHNGLLFGAERSNELAQHLRRLLADAALREKLARNGLETAKEHALDRQVARVVEVYRHVV
jgi:glycosyltransferase involved in cell wall biosynthesis